MDGAEGDQLPDIDALRHIVPFRFLSAADRASLAASFTERRIAAGAEVYRAGDSDTDVFVLVSGRVETTDPGSQPDVRINQIESGHYFGERAALFDMPREYTLRAVEDSVVYSLSGARFLGLIHSSRAFAQALGTILREKQGIFDAFDRFSAELTLGLGRGSIDIRRLLPLYRGLEPALHPGANSSEIDFAALKYAILRLPENVTQTFIYLYKRRSPGRVFSSR